MSECLLDTSGVLPQNIHLALKIQVQNFLPTAVPYGNKQAFPIRSPNQTLQIAPTFHLNLLQLFPLLRKM
jgi:hypothetical protein